MPVNEPGAPGHNQYPSDNRVDDPEVPHIRRSGALTESPCRPSARIVVLACGPDSHQDSHANGGHDDLDTEMPPTFDLPNRPLACELITVAPGIRVNVGGRATAAGHSDPSFRLRSPNAVSYFAPKNAGLI